MPRARRTESTAFRVARPTAPSACSARRPQQPARSTAWEASRPRPRGAGVVAINSAGGADLLLGDESTSAALTESGIDRPFPGPMVFDVTNSDASGTITLRVDASDVVTTLTDQDTTYSNGNQLELDGTTFNVLEGAGSGLDADLLDDHHAASFALSAETYTREEVDTLLARQHAPFMVRTGDVTCAEVGQVDHDFLVIDSTGDTGYFEITSVAFTRPVGVGGGIDPSSVIQVEEYCIDRDVSASGCYTIGTADLFDGTGFEILGSDPEYGRGLFVRRLTASSGGSNDIVLDIKCFAQGDDIRFPEDGIIVSGWNQQGETVTLSYLEENPFAP